MLKVFYSRVLNTHTCLLINILFSGYVYFTNLSKINLTRLLFIETCILSPFKVELLCLLILTLSGLNFGI